MTMQAIEITAFGAPDVLRVCQRPVPVPGAGELLIRVHASGVNRPDVLQRLGKYPAPVGASDIPGLEVAGLIVQGDVIELASTCHRLGDRVCALVSGGGYAQYCVAPIAQCLTTPDGLDDVEAASLPETFFTVWSNLIDRAHLAADETVLIQGGSGGIGVAAIQLAKAVGARVFVTAGTEEKCAACLALGADAAICYPSQDFQTEVARLTNGQGVDVILDVVAGDYVAKEIQCLKEDGRLVIIATQGGSTSKIDAGRVLRKRLTITGSTLRSRPAAFKAAIAQSLYQTVWPWLESGQIKPVVHRTFAAEEAAQAHALMDSGQHIGKIVLTWKNV